MVFEFEHSMIVIFAFEKRRCVHDSLWILHIFWKQQCERPNRLCFLHAFFNGLKLRTSLWTVCFMAAFVLLGSATFKRHVRPIVWFYIVYVVLNITKRIIVVPPVDLIFLKVFVCYWTQRCVYGFVWVCIISYKVSSVFAFIYRKLLHVVYLLYV